MKLSEVVVFKIITYLTLKKKIANILHWELSGWTLCEVQKQNKNLDQLVSSKVLMYALNLDTVFI